METVILVYPAVKYIKKMYCLSSMQVTVFVFVSIWPAKQEYSEKKWLPLFPQSDI